MDVQKFYVSNRLAELIKKKIDYKDDGHVANTFTFSTVDINLNELISTIETHQLPLLMKHKNYPNALIQLSNGLIWPALDKIHQAFSFKSFSGLNLDADSVRFPTKDELFSYLNIHPQVLKIEKNQYDPKFALKFKDDQTYVKHIKIQNPKDFLPKLQLIADPNMPDLNLELKCFESKENILQLLHDKVIYYEHTESQKLLEKLIKDILDKNGSTKIIKVSLEQQKSLAQLFLNLETILTKDQPLNEEYLIDPNAGLWEFALHYKKTSTDVLVQLSSPWQAADPNRLTSINQDSKVVIDFGSSSTIVVVEEQGSPKLLQLSFQNDHMNDSQRFENPTYLSIYHYQNFKETWFQQGHKAYLSATRTFASMDLKYASTVKNTLNDSFLQKSEGDHEAILRNVRASMSMFKQWAMEDQKQNFQKYYYDEQDEKTRFQAKILTDQEAEKLDSQVLDPIELYAYVIGSFINSRRHKIHQEYYMTFPVKYNDEAKNKILSSFKRGIKKSLPSAFKGNIDIYQIASEPSAIVAKAFKLLKIKPDETGIPYAVFDFGGGTADFSYGLYRKANHNVIAEETFHRVIEQYGRGGDQYLGGENILNELADIIFCEEENLKQFQKDNIVFERPLNVPKINVPAFLIDQNNPYARINRSIIITTFEWLWKDPTVMPKAFTDMGFKLDSSNDFALNLYTTLKDKDTVISKSVNLKINPPKIIQMIKQKIVNGFINFLRTLLKAFEGKSIISTQKIQLILAGNSCKSYYVKNLVEELFPKNLSDQNSNDYYQKLLSITDQDVPFVQALWSYITNIEIRNDLLNGIQDDALNTEINGKTVLAAGLLDLCPGGKTLLIEEENDQQITSLYALGIWDDEDEFQVCLPLAATIESLKNGSVNAITNMGTASNGYFNLVYSNIAGKHLKSQLKQKVWQVRIQFESTQHKYVWMIPVSKHSYALFALETKDFDHTLFHQWAYQSNLRLITVNIIDTDPQVEDKSYQDVFPL